jgi:hypothetical protein
MNAGEQLALTGDGSPILSIQIGVDLQVKGQWTSLPDNNPGPDIPRQTGKKVPDRIFVSQKLELRSDGAV